MGRSLEPEHIAEKIAEYPITNVDMERDGNVVFVDLSDSDIPNVQAEDLVDYAQDLAVKNDAWAEDQYPADRKLRITVER